MLPGKSGKIPVKISTKRGASVKKIIKVRTNIPGPGGTVELVVQGELWEPFDVKPQGVSFGRLTPAEAQAASAVEKVTLFNNMEQDASIVNVRSNNAFFRPELRVIEPGRQFELTVAITSPLPWGGTSGKIQMATGIDEAPTFSVPVRAYVMFDLDLNPAQLTIRGTQPERTTKEFVLRNNTTNPIAVSELKVSNPALQVNLQETTPGTRFKITLDLPPNYAPPPGGDKITFKTDCPSATDVTIPILSVKDARRSAAGKGRISHGLRPPGAARQSRPSRSRPIGPRPAGQPVKPEKAAEPDN